MSPDIAVNSAASHSTVHQSAAATSGRNGRRRSVSRGAMVRTIMTEELASESSSSGRVAYKTLIYGSYYEGVLSEARDAKAGHSVCFRKKRTEKPERPMQRKCASDRVVHGYFK